MYHPVELDVMTPVPDRVLHMKTGVLTSFRFEWHPAAQRVYVIRIGQTPEVGELIAFDIATHGAALNAVNVWSRGFRTGLADKPLPALTI